ncbi:MAG: hypothetical protein KKC50_08085 [Candidatus Omnitrophica bacterium]|nr:hypothetical protein [Candidatus Omnitrophota bacterium]
MGVETNLLKLMVQGDKEVKTFTLNVTSVAAKLVSQLSDGYQRKALFAYNASDTASGECEWGDSAVTVGTGMIIPAGSISAVPLSTSVDVYFVSTNPTELRILEIA